MELIVVRHGQTEWSLSGRHTGTTDIELTEHGVVEASAAAIVLQRFLDGRTPRVFSSPRARAMVTAELALPDVPFEVEPLLAEFGYGEYEGLTYPEIRALDPTWNIWEDGCPGGESPDQASARAGAFLESRVRPAGDAPVVAVTHGHFSRILAARALGRPAVDASIFDSSTGSVSVIKDYRDQPLVHRWNVTP